jgi:uncharacterized protein (TIGR02466 family)
MIKDIFKVPVCINKLKLDTKKIETFCTNLKLKDKGRTISNIGGWQSDDLNLNKKIIKLKELLVDITKHGDLFVNSLKIKNKDKIKIHNLWININEYKDYNISHKHPGSLISGVYYVKTPKDCGNIIFEHPSEILTCEWRKEYSEYNNYNSQTWWLPSEENYLYLFPSWLKHRVEPNLNKNENRISISFNLV